MPDAVDPVERIDALLTSAEPRIKRAFLAAIKALRDDLDLGEIEQLLINGDTEAALRYTQDVALSIGEASTVTFITSGQSTSQFLNGLDLGTILFDQVNNRAVAAMQSNSLRLIQEFTAEQRRATSLALIDGIGRGLNPRDQARTFRDSIGLTERQQAAVINYRRLLTGAADQQREAMTRELRDRRFDRTINRSINTGDPLTDDQIERMVDRYRDRYVKYRSEVIARTEALRSVHEGVNEGYQQAIDAGKIDETDLVRTWDSSKDTRVRHTHRILDGQKRAWGKTWQTANGVLRYPGDPSAPAVETVQCRCLLTTRIKGAVKTIRKYSLIMKLGRQRTEMALAA
jgi:hypothetical protein